MIDECGYKQENYCNCFKKTTEEVENETGEKCCDTCHQAIAIYSEKDKIKLLYEALRSANKEKSAYDVMYMRGIYGHDCALKDDFDDLYYKGYSLWLVLHKKYKYVDHSDIVTVYECMQQMGMKIPKRLHREIRRIKKNCEKYEDYLFWS